MIQRSVWVGPSPLPKEFLEYLKSIKNSIILRFGKMKKKSIIMHALPRVDELSTDVDPDSRAVYLRNQVRNGLFVRMALLAAVLGKI
mgnify:CR=1 FL=1